MERLLFRDVMLVDAQGSARGDLYVENGAIAAVGPQLPHRAQRVVDGSGLTLMPGLVDLHAHFRDPGLTHKEDIHTGCRAAVHGGFTAVHLMPNTRPVCSSGEMVRQVRRKAAELDICDVYQSMSITRNFDGESLDHLADLDESVRWITDDGFGVDRTGTMYRAMAAAKERGIGVMLHEEDSGLRGVDSYLAEELMTFRDVELACLTGCKTHFQHVSTIKCLEYILDGKGRGGDITFEVTPHHLFLNDTDGGKVNPPLRGEEHRQALIRCVGEGWADAIATDHAPHTPEEKQAGANGFTGLDLAFATCYTVLVREGVIDLSRLSGLLSRNPARLLGLDKGLLHLGMEADLVLVDTGASFTASEQHIHSKSKNSPMLGKTLYGEIQMTVKRGRIVYEKAH